MAEGTSLFRGAKSRTDPLASSSVTRAVTGNDSTILKADDDADDMMAVAAAAGGTVLLLRLAPRGRKEASTRKRHPLRLACSAMEWKESSEKELDPQPQQSIRATTNDTTPLT
jgi:hypothetical protein